VSFLYMNCNPICMTNVVLTGEMDYFPSQFSLLFSTCLRRRRKNTLDFFKSLVNFLDSQVLFNNLVFSFFSNLCIFAKIRLLRFYLFFFFFFHLPPLYLFSYFYNPISCLFCVFNYLLFAFLLIYSFFSILPLDLSHLSFSSFSNIIYVLFGFGFLDLVCFIVDLCFVLILIFYIKFGMQHNVKLCFLLTGGQMVK